MSANCACFEKTRPKKTPKTKPHAIFARIEKSKVASNFISTTEFSYKYYSFKHWNNTNGENNSQIQAT